MLSIVTCRSVHWLLWHVHADLMITVFYIPLCLCGTPLSIGKSNRHVCNGALIQSPFSCQTFFSRPGHPPHDDRLWLLLAFKRMCNQLWWSICSSIPPWYFWITHVCILMPNAPITLINTAIGYLQLSSTSVSFTPEASWRDVWVCSMPLLPFQVSVMPLNSFYFGLLMARTFRHFLAC